MNWDVLGAITEWTSQWNERAGSFENDPLPFSLWIKGSADRQQSLTQVYVTYGSDSGHQDRGRSFLDNAQALSNGSHEAVKRTRLCRADRRDL